MVARLSGTKSRASFLLSMSSEYCQEKALMIRDKQLYCATAVIFKPDNKLSVGSRWRPNAFCGMQDYFLMKVVRLTKLKSVQNQSQFVFDNLPFLCLPG
jgi:hypothetical protein